MSPTKICGSVQSGKGHCVPYQKVRVWYKVLRDIVSPTKICGSVQSGKGHCVPYQKVRVWYKVVRDIVSPTKIKKKSYLYVFKLTSYKLYDYRHH
jgi:hypothetical protein